VPRNPHPFLPRKKSRNTLGVAYTNQPTPKKYFEQSRAADSKLEVACLNLDI
jgi:hypothetical protein